MDQEVKSKWLSKTLWINLIVAAASFFPAVADKISPETVMQALAVINIILRFATKDKISLIK